MAMSTVLISTIAALTGSAIGAMSPILSNHLIQQGQTKRDLINRQIGGREALYSAFIQEASSLYAHSMTHNLEDPDRVVAFYSLIARIRLQSSTPVVAAAEAFGRLVMVRYGEVNINIEQMRTEALGQEVDPLNKFSIACRHELLQLFERGVASDRE